MGDIKRNDSETVEVNKWVTYYDKRYGEKVVNLPIRDFIIINRKVEGFIYIMYPLTKRECFDISKLIKSDRESDKFSVIPKFDDNEGYTTKQIVCLGELNVDNQKDFNFVYKLLQTSKDIYIPKDYDVTNHTGVIKKDCLIHDYKLYWEYLYNCIGNPERFIVIKKAMKSNANWI